jgi:hypothetical protein
MAPPLKYTAIDDGRADDRGSVEEFLLRCLIGARDESNLPSNSSGFDEDVNVYVVGLLGRFLSAEYHDEARRYCYPTDLDLAREIEAQDDERFCYRAYRTNADQLFLGVGLFSHVEGHGVSTDPIFGRSPEELCGRGSTYYSLASSSLRRLRRRSTGPEQAMNKLSARFDDYTTILKRVRTSYFHLTCRIGEGALFHLARPGERAEGRAEQWDRFLDAWSEWKRTGEDDARARLCDTAELLRQTDPSFSFELPEA